MFALLVTPTPSGALDSGLLAAILVATGVTAVAALVMAAVSLHRTARLTGLSAFALTGLGLGVSVIAVAAVVTISPSSAQANPEPDGPTYLVTSSDPGLQLPTVALD